MTGETDRVYRTVVSFVIKSGGSEFYGLLNNRRNLLIVERPTTDYYFSAYHMQADHRSRWQTELHGVSSCSICKKNPTVPRTPFKIVCWKVIQNPFVGALAVAYFTLNHYFKSTNGQGNVGGLSDLSMMIDS